MTDNQALVIPLTGEVPIACPRCGSDGGLHFDEVSLIDPQMDVVPLHAEGTEGLSVATATLANGALPDRKHRIVLPHWCSNCGARGEIVLRHHDGQTIGQYREVGDS